ncbi:MAG TPA: twin-arginine translocation signal domain-containing protein, partial [Gemmataceae bacterium]|nr:twin-arginine translocation signal domain-containing protein [Gemmataceae bacterium]
MEDRKIRCSRRKFLAQAAALTLTGTLSAAETVAPQPAPSRARPTPPTPAGRKPIAVVCTVCRPLSFAAHLMD